MRLEMRPIGPKHIPTPTEPPPREPPSWLRGAEFRVRKLRPRYSPAPGTAYEENAGRPPLSRPNSETELPESKESDADWGRPPGGKDCSQVDPPCPDEEAAAPDVPDTADTPAAVRLKEEVDRILEAKLRGTWRTVLGLGPNFSAAELDRRRRELFLMLHPEPGLVTRSVSVETQMQHLFVGKS